MVEVFINTRNGTRLYVEMETGEATALVGKWSECEGGNEVLALVGCVDTASDERISYVRYRDIEIIAYSLEEEDALAAASVVEKPVTLERYMATLVK